MAIAAQPHTIKEEYTMNILKTNATTPAEIYNLTMNPQTQKMSNFKDSAIRLARHCLYEDVDAKTGEVKEILTIMDENGTVYATNSKTFQDDFFKMVELFEGMGATVNEIAIISGTSKSGREFISCKFIS